MKPNFNHNCFIDEKKISRHMIIISSLTKFSRNLYPKVIWFFNGQNCEYVIW
jgi:hypothetical protein